MIYDQRCTFRAFVDFYGQYYVGDRVLSTLMTQSINLAKLLASKVLVHLYHGIHKFPLNSVQYIVNSTKSQSFHVQSCHDFRYLNLVQVLMPGYYILLHLQFVLGFNLRASLVVGILTWTSLFIGWGTYISIGNNTKAYAR